MTNQGNSAPVAIGDVVQFMNADGADEKPRTGVVINLSGDLAGVIYGTGTAREGDRYGIRERTQAATALGLYKDTYFYPDHVRLVGLELLTVKGRCPPAVLVELRALFNKGVRHLKTLRP
jgi:hypothetical protein